MKGILFYYDNPCAPGSRGGTELATLRIARALAQSGEFRLYDAFRRGSFGPETAPYDAVIRLSRAKSRFINGLADFITQNRIDVIINMGRFFRHPLLAEAIRKSRRPVRLLFMHHFAPGSETKKQTYAAGRHLLKLDPLNPLYWLRASLYPLIKLPRRLRYADAYRRVVDTSDMVVLLSKGYIEHYARIAAIDDKSSFIAIPNIYDPPLSAAGKTALPPKEKRVLILSRMDEIQKRISLALKIWQKIEAQSDLDAWHLDIVGSGHDEKALKKLAKKLGLRNVSFHGWQPPQEFLSRSAILMMTSEYEGLPLTLLEAQAYGCIPVAFDSFASLQDAVSDWETGVIVRNFGDVNDFAYKLMDIMRHPDVQTSLAENARRQSSKFSSPRVLPLWLDLLRSL